MLHSPSISKSTQRCDGGGERVLPRCGRARCDGKVGGCYLGVVGRVLPRCDGEGVT